MEMTRVTVERWHALWRELELTARPAWHERLLVCYREPQRHYHTLQHLDDCLREFDGARHLAKNPPAVELAIWFHDAVYDSHASDNEERSADLAVECLAAAGAPETMRSVLSGLVLATKCHVPSTPDEALLIDIDLSILGQSRERFAEYESQVRQEYHWVPKQVFAEKRSEVLRRFLGKPRIYSTEHFYSRYESRARENLNGSIEQLCHGFS